MQGYGGNYSSRGGGGAGGAGSSRPSSASGAGRGAPRKSAVLCTSCQAPLSQDEMLESHQTEGRCVACQQMVEAQSACRVCHLPWSTDQHDVVSCNACGFFMHDYCVKKGAIQCKSGGRTYTFCPHCPPTVPDAGSGSSGEASPVAQSHRGHVKSEPGSGGLNGRQGSGGSGSGGGRVAAAAATAIPLASLTQQQAVALLPGNALLVNPGVGGMHGGQQLLLGSASPPSAVQAVAVVAAQQQQQQAALQQVAASLQGQLRTLQGQQRALLRQYELQLRAVVPGEPPSAFMLFQQDMLRVYQEEGFDIDPVELQPIIANAWHQLTTEERAGYDARAAQETLSYSATAQMYVQLFHEYETLAAQVGTAVDGMLLPKAMSGLLAAVRTQSQQRLVGGPTSRPTGRLPPAGSGTGMAGGAMASAFGPASRMAGGVGGGGAGFGGGAVPGGASAGRGAKRPLDALVGASALMGMTKGSGKGVVSGEDDDDDEDYETEGTKRRRMPSVPSGGGGAGGGAAGGGSWSLQRPPPRNTRLPAEKLPTCIADLPQQLTVSCNEVAGLFIMDGIKVICRCKVCVDQPKGQREFHPTHWEQHCGAGTAKKWKASIKIEPGGAPEVPLGSYPMQIGKWFDMLGVEFRPARTTGGPPVLEFTGAIIGKTAFGGQPGANGGPSPGQTPPPHGPMQQELDQLQQQESVEPPLLPAPRPVRVPQSQQQRPGSAGAPSGGGRRNDENGGGGGGGGGATTFKIQPRPVSDGDALVASVDVAGDCVQLGGPDPRASGKGALAQALSCEGEGGRGKAGKDGESSSSRGSASDTIDPHAA